MHTISRKKRLPIAASKRWLFVVVLVLALATAAVSAFSAPSADDMQRFGSGSGSFVSTDNDDNSNTTKNNYGPKDFFLDWDCHVPSALRIILERAWEDAKTLSKTPTPPTMNYALFRGVSTLRSLPKDQEELLNPSHYGIHNNGLTTKEQRASFSRVVALLLLLQGNPGAAHEVLLGVTLDELERAEYAATHPGQTSWAQDHATSFEDASDWIHSILHRLEGPNLGEGNHTGFENAKYWAKGGPKQLDQPAKHGLRNFLAQQAPRVAPRLCQTNRLQLQDGCWNDLAFIELCQFKQEGKLSPPECDEVAILSCLEIWSLLHQELQLALTNRIDKNMQ